MDTLDSGIQYLVTGGKCEEEGCEAAARWYLTRGNESFHLCASHAAISMEEKEFWQQRTEILQFIPP